MSDPSQSPGTLQIPADTQAAFAAIIELIKGSASMNDEERQYWINILPAMTPDQLKNLEEILTSEKKQLSAIDTKYDEGGGVQAAGGASVAAIGEKIRERKKDRQQKEQEAEEHEKNDEEELLSKIQSF